MTVPDPKTVDTLVRIARFVFWLLVVFGAALLALWLFRPRPSAHPPQKAASSASPAGGAPQP